MKQEFAYKGYGRILVDSEADIERVKNILFELDSFEFGYLPEGLITADKTADYTNVGKFDPNIENLMNACTAAKIHVVINSMSAIEHDDPEFFDFLMSDDEGSN